MRSYFKKGSFNRIGDDDGFKHKAEDTRERWDGLIVSRKGWEPRNEQEFVRGIPDRQSVQDARPEASDTFLNQGVLDTGSPLLQDPLNPFLAAILQENGTFLMTDNY